MLFPTPVQGEIPWLKHDPVRSLALAPDTVLHTTWQVNFFLLLDLLLPRRKGAPKVNALGTEMEVQEPPTHQSHFFRCF